MGLINILTFVSLAANVGLALTIFIKMRKWRQADLRSLRDEIKDDMAAHGRHLREHKAQLDRQQEKLSRLWANVFAPNRVRPAPFPAEPSPEPAPGFAGRARFTQRVDGDRRSTARVDERRSEILAKMPPPDMPSLSDGNPIFGQNFGNEAATPDDYVARTIRDGKGVRVPWASSGQPEVWAEDAQGGSEAPAPAGAAVDPAPTPKDKPDDDFQATSFAATERSPLDIATPTGLMFWNGLL